MANPKRLFFDIETSPNIGLFWSAGYKQNISYDNIISERAIICICYKWAGEKRVHGITWDSKQNDKKMLQEFIKVANTADELVGHNGDNFDLKWIRTRCLFHGVQAFPTYTTIDTLKAARSKFRFNSNRLDYIAKYLGIGAKIKTEFNLWKEIVLEKSDKALGYMVKYCKGDVELLEQVFNKMSNHLAPKVHHGVVAEKHKYTCPECGGDHIHFIRKRISPTGYKKEQRQCQDCGKYFTITTQ
jgi:uncharacterized protein YprB with RNaseH-like and TPR domain